MKTIFHLALTHLTSIIDSCLSGSIASVKLLRIPGEIKKHFHENIKAVQRIQHFQTVLHETGKDIETLIQPAVYYFL